MRRSIAAAATTLLLLGACSAGDDTTPTTAQGTADASPAPDPTATSEAAPAQDPRDTPPDEDAGPAQTPDGSSEQPTTSSSTTDGCTRRPGHDGPAPSTLSEPAAAGTYEYVVDGTWSYSGRQDRDGELPERSTRERTALRDRDGDSYRFDEVRRGESDRETTITFHVTGESVVFEHWEGPERSFTPTPPIVVLEFPLAVGKTWESTGTDGQATMTASAEVLRQERVEVCGSSYPAWVIDGQSTIIAGAFKVETQGTSWMATGLGGLVLRDEGTSHTTFEAQEFRTEAERSLVSIVPD